MLGTVYPCLLMVLTFLNDNLVLLNLYLSQMLNCICLQFSIVFVSNFELNLSQLYLLGTMHLPADVSDLSDQRQFEFSVILSEFRARPLQIIGSCFSQHFLQIQMRNAASGGSPAFQRYSLCVSCLYNCFR